MFNFIKELFKPKKDIVELLMEPYKPRTVDEEILNSGNIRHKHKFHYADWEYDRLGKSVEGLNKEKIKSSFMPMVIYKNLYKCKCGAEKIVREAGLL